MEVTTTQKQQNRVKDLLKLGIDFKEHYINLADMKAVKGDGYKKEMGAGSKRNLRNTKIEFKGSQFSPSDRFWLSFCAIVGIAPSVLNLFDHDEVFDRVISQNKISANGNIRVIEDVKNKQLLAMTSPEKATAHWESVLELIDDKDGYDVNYNDGIISSMHSLRADLPVKVGGEDFRQRIAVHTPIDGYGMPSVYLALLRQVCSNGMIAMSKAFKTSIKVGKKRGKDQDDNVEFALERMFDSFSNDEGFDALIKRLDAARASKLSVREFYQVSEILSSLNYKSRRETSDKSDKASLLDISQELRSWHNLGGNLHSRYGLVHLKEMTEKQMSLLETDLTVYEAVNFITEVTSHRLNPMVSKDINTSNRLHGWVGTAIARPYDLEGTLTGSEVKGEFQDLYFNPSLN